MDAMLIISAAKSEFLVSSCLHSRWYFAFLASIPLHVTFNFVIIYLTSHCIAGAHHGGPRLVYKSQRCVYLDVIVMVIHGSVCQHPAALMCLVSLAEYAFNYECGSASEQLTSSPGAASRYQTPLLPLNLPYSSATAQPC